MMAIDTNGEVIGAQGSNPGGMPFKLSGAVVLKDSGSPAIVVMLFAFLPWLAAVFLTAGVAPALSLCGYAAAVSAAGYAILCAGLPCRARPESIVLAPAIGILLLSGSAGLCLRGGSSMFGVWLLWLVLTAVGLLFFFRDGFGLVRATVSYGKTLAFLSLLICAVYFLPGARNDAVLRPDGGFNWIYVDTQFFHAVASSIKDGMGPPRSPATFTTDLYYHFAPYAPAALISRFIGLGLGDALARVTRGASLWALVLSSFGVGTLLARRATGKSFGGILCVAGLFFYGSILSLFTNETNTASHVTGAILFQLPDVAVLADGGPFSHLVLGHSMLHALVAITAILGLCLEQQERMEDIPRWRLLAGFMLLACSVAVNSVASLYCAGILGILLFCGHLQSWRSWLLIFLMFGFFILAWKLMGYGQATESAHVVWKERAFSQWWSVTVAFLFGLGLRTVAFRWIKLPLKDPVSVLVLASVVGLLAFSLLLRFDGSNERYGIYYLQCMFSLFAFARLKHGFWRPSERMEWLKDWAAISTAGLAVLSASGVLIGIGCYLAHTHPDISAFRIKLAIALVLLLFLGYISVAIRRSQPVPAIGSGILVGVLLFGFLGWIPAWLNFGMGRMQMDVTLTPGEVQGLSRFSQIASPGARFATNRHIVDSLASRQERSYSYSAFSERPVLLEGYLDHAIRDLPWFPSMLRQNDLLFTTTSPETLLGIAQHWNVQWLVARPGTDIALPRPLPPWLSEQPDSGDLKIYKIEGQVSQ